MSEKKLLSIILPVYNCEKYISETIESLLAQTFTDFDLLIIDDGSQDETVEIIKSFKDDRIKLYQNEHKGIIDTFNFGFKKVNSKYTARVDGDDIYFKNKIEKQIEYLEKNKDVVLLGTDAFYMSEKSKKTKIRITVPRKNDEILSNLLSKKRAIIQSTIIARTEFIKLVGGYEEHVYPEDYNLFLKLSKRGQICNLSLPLAYIRIHKSFSHNNLNMLIKNHDKLISDFGVEEINKSSYYNIYLNRMALYNYLNGCKLIGILQFTLSFFISPVKTIRNLFYKIVK